MHIVAQLFDMISWHSAVTAGISTSLCLMFVGLAGRYPRLAGHTGNLTAVQAAHKQSTPRVAGVAIFAALVVSIFFVTEALSHHYLVFIAAASLVFVPGLLEDIGFGVSPRRRLLVAVVASMTIILTLDIWLTRSDSGWFEPYMANAFVGVSLTVLVTVGVTNGFNLIDGVNGLAGLAAMACSLALALIAHQAGY